MFIVTVASLSAAEWAYQLSLLHKSRAVLAHCIHHAHGCCSPEAGLGLASHQEGVHEGLGVVLANAHQQVVYQPPHRLHCCVDARYHLQRKQQLRLEC